MTHTNRNRLAVDLGGAWRLYWTGPLPDRAQAIGTVTRAAGDTGALILSPLGQYWQGNVRALRSLDQSKIAAAIAGARLRPGPIPADGVRGMIRKNVTLDPATIERLRALGDGDLSLGIRRAATKLSPADRRWAVIAKTDKASFPPRVRGSKVILRSA